MSRNFIQNQSGAVTVDWVVLTAGLVGLGLATMAVVSTGVQDTSDDIEDQLTTDIIRSAFASSRETFASGADGWSGAGVSEVDGFGGILGPIGPSGGLESVSKTYDIPEDAESATFTLDVLAIDSHDSSTGDGPVLYVGGQEVGRAVANHDGTIAWQFHEIDGISVDYEVTASGDIGNVHPTTSRTWRDSVTAVSITVDDPGTELSLGFGSTANQSISDESIALDNITLSTS